ncbi:motile sperm domain-containing protein 1 [Dendroctonus ponderosae]
MRMRGEHMRHFRQTPIFAFPPSLTFFLGSKHSHVQVLTLYNPYEFPIKYKVHCHSSAWEKYIVPNPEGIIPNESSIDLAVTHKQAIPSNCNVTDKLKVVMQDIETDEILGRKTVEAVLLPGTKEGPDSVKDEHGNGALEGEIRGSVARSNVTAIPVGNSIFLGFIIVVCAVVLFLPAEVQVSPPSDLPSYLHMPHKIQLLAALLLGMCLCLVVRQ